MPKRHRSSGGVYIIDEMADRWPATKCPRLPQGGAPSVTTVLDATLPAPALVPWAAKEEAKVWQGAIRARPGAPPDEVIASVGDVRQHTRILAEASALGAAAHAMIEMECGKGGAVLRNAYPNLSDEGWTGANRVFDAWKQWAESVKWKPLMQEETVYDPIGRSVGTFDAIGLVNGEPTLCDWKSSSGIYPKMLTQVSAYAFMAIASMQISALDKYPNVAIVRLPKTIESLEKMEADYGSPVQVANLNQTEQGPFLTLWHRLRASYDAIRLAEQAHRKAVKMPERQDNWD